MQEILHTADLLWQGLAFLRRSPVDPVIEEGLQRVGVESMAWGGWPYLARE